MKTGKKIAVVLCLFFLFASCRNEEEAVPRIEKLIFEENEKELYVGDTVYVNINTHPLEAKDSENIKYTAEKSDVIEIMSDSNNSSVKFKGLKRGRTIIYASANGVFGYLTVNVLGGEDNVIPHIVVSDYVFECLRGESRSIVASLRGGTPLDDNAFVWNYSNATQQIISFEATNNVGIFEAKKFGESVITVSHPKAQFSVKILVFVKDKDDVPVYITTDNNVINLKTNDNMFEYMVNLYGSSKSSDNYYFEHVILEGESVIGLRYNNNIGTVTPKKSGIARIGVSHRDAAHDIEIIVIVTEEVVYNYIDVDNSLIIMEENHVRFINAVLAGDAPDDHPNKYEFINENDEVVLLEQSQNAAKLSGLKKGKSVITIKNEYADFEREVLVIINGAGEMVDNSFYITTNQNVITTEVNGEAELTMSLVGGNTADANNFIWTVEDGSIIDVKTNHGEVRYINRAMIAAGNQSFEAVAYIKAKKVGTTKITIENPKAKNDFSVIVKVYKQGVFGVVPVVLDGQGLYKLEINKTIEMNLRVVAGLERSLANIEWISDNPAVFSVESSAGLTGVLKGKKQGVANLTVKADNLKNNYTAMVIVGDDYYLGTQPYVYVESPFMSVIKGNSVTFRVECMNMNSDQITNLSVVNNDPEKMEVFAYRNNITVKGISLGEGNIVISGDGLNTIIICVSVEDYVLTPETPFYLRTNRYIYGVVKNRKIEVSVDLVGGITYNEKHITWSIEDSKVASIESSGKKCLIDGKNEGQTVLTVSHAQSNNRLEIVIYVVLNDNELNTKIIMHISQQNILLTLGQTKYISIITNASSVQQNAFFWNYTNPNIIGVSVGTDKIKAYITAKGIGNATISVGSGSQIPLVIYVSVTSAEYNNGYINVPSIVEMVVGQTISVNAAIGGIIDSYNINWKSGNEAIAKVYGNGDVCTITAYKAEKTLITVTYNDFIKNIYLCIYGSLEEMANAYVFAAEQSRYVINKDDIITVNLVFGMKGYPEHMQQSIRWFTGDSIKIRVEGNSGSASIKGLNVGVGIVNVSDDLGNSVDIEIVVQEFGKVGKYSFSIKEYGKTAGGEDRIIGVVAGSYVDLEIKVFNGTTEITNISGIKYGLDNNDIMSIEDRPFGIRVRTKAGMEGSGYITLNHDLIEDARILVYTALSEGALRDAFPLLIEKTNYLIKKGGSITVNIITKPDDGNRLRNISYDLEKDNSVINVSERGKTEIIISAQKAGSDIVLVRYNAEIVQRLYISVVEENFGANSGYLVTENIIGIIEGEYYETRIDTNNNAIFNWYSDNDNICSISNITFNTARLSGLKTGKTTVTVRMGLLERKITVFVVRDEDELNVLQAINVEQRKYQIRKNDNFMINICSYQGRVEGKTDYEDYYKYSLPYGNVISVNFIDNGKLSVKGLNEGVAAVRITNDYYHDEFVIFVEVYSDTGEGGINVVNNKHYITAEKTLYVIGEEEKNVYVSVNVVGDDFLGDSEWVWQGYDPDIIEVNALGRSAVVNPLRKGTTKLQVINGKCENNPFEIVIIAGDRFEIDNSKLPYISVEKDLYEAVKNGGDISIPYSIVNVEKVDAKKIYFEVINSNIEVKHDLANGVFTVTPKETGIAKFVIKYSNLTREVYVLVKENIDAGAVYLTTSENYVIASIGELRNIRIDLAGYNELDSSKLKWSVSDKSPKNVIQLSGNGTIGEIYGVSEGDVVVNVTHLRNDIYRAFNTLTINVRIVKDKSKENVIYLTTQKNVVEVVKGSQSEIIYVQKVGGDINNSQLTWNTSDRSKVTLDEIRGNAARILAHSEGEVKITVSNIEAKYDLEIIVIVRDSLNNNIYISSSETLIWLRPGQTGWKINVVLVNGDEKYNNNFVWKIEAPQHPSDEKVKQAQGKVINIFPSNNICLIDAVNDGVAYIRVENPGKAEKPLIITVYVSQYKEIAFSFERKELIIGEYEFVELKLPTYEYLQDKARVWVEDLNGGPTDLLDVYYTNSLILLNGREEGLRGKDDGFVIVKAALEGKNSYAQMLVHVVKHFDPNVNRIVVAKNIYVTSLKADNIIINALAAGPEIFDVDVDFLRWGIITNDNGDSSKPFITMIPQSNGIGIDENGEKFNYHASGRQVQVGIKNEGTAILRVMHEKVPPEYWKDIHIIIEDLGNYFTIDKKEVSVNMSRPETVSVNIVGGTTQDYAQVKWIAKMQQKWDGTLLEIVRIMGSGREVALYPLNDGETEVYAFFNGKMVSCKVTAFSDYYLNFRSGEEYMFPGEVRDIPFDIRPVNSNLNWIPQGAFLNEDKTKVIFSHLEITGSPVGGEGPSQRMLRIIAENEGGGNLIAMANGKMAQVNVIVAYDYEFKIDNGRSTSRSGYPQYEIKTDEFNGMFEKTCDGVIEVGYYVYPSNTYIEVDEETVPVGLNVEIKVGPETKDNKGKTLGTGMIKFTSVKELSAAVKFQQYKAWVPNEAKQAVDGAERQYIVRYAFPDQNIYPYFMRGDGKYSNTYDHTGIKKPKNRGQYLLKSTNKPIEGGEVIQKYSSGYGSNDFTLDLMDGEVHHILFDKLFDNMNINGNNMQISLSMSGSKNPMPIDIKNDDIRIDIDMNDRPEKNKIYWPDTLADQLKSFNFNIKLVDVSYGGVQQKAIRLSGGKDYIEYTRVAYPKELFMYTDSPYAASNVQQVITNKNIEHRKINNVPIWTILRRNASSWYQAGLSDFYYDQENHYSVDKTFTLLDRDFLFDNFSEEELVDMYEHFKFKKIGSHPYLVEYNGMSDKNYEYFIMGDEYERIPVDLEQENLSEEELEQLEKIQKMNELWVKVFIQNQSRVIIKNIQYFYDYDVYLKNKSTFEMLNNNYFFNNGDNLLRDKDNIISGGYYVSTYALDNRLYDINERSMSIYQYRKDLIKQYIAAKNNIYLNGESKHLALEIVHDNSGLEIEKIGGWEEGYFNIYNRQDVIPYEFTEVITDRNTGLSETVKIEYLYSSYLYNFDEISYVPKEGANTVSMYDVFEPAKSDLSAVYLRVPQYVSGSIYDEGAKGYGAFGPPCNRPLIEVMSYENIYFKLPVYLWTNAPNYTYFRGGGNIFDGDHYTVKYGEYGPATFQGKTVSSHYTGGIFSGTAVGQFYDDNLSLGIFTNGSGGANVLDNIFGACRNRVRVWWDPWYKMHVAYDHPNEAYVTQYYGYARNMLKWEDKNTYVVVPYDYFNRFPYRYENKYTGGISQIVGLNHENGKPMPSVNRKNKFINATSATTDQVIITITYTNNSGKTCHMYIYVNLYIKPCHSEYEGEDAEDDKVKKYNKNNMPEKEGEVRNFGQTGLTGRKVEILKPFIK